MYTTKAGQKFGSSYVGKKKDAMHENDAAPEAKAAEEKNPFSGAKPPMTPVKPTVSADHEAKETPEFEQGEKEGAQEGEGAQAVVAAHGPATSVHVTHDHVAKKHHVTSTHKDGHVHESDHADPAAAHAEAAQLGGSPAETQGPPPEGAGAPESDGFSMPPLG